MQAKDKWLIDPDVVQARIREVVGDEPKEFAYQVGISESAVYNYTGGLRVPSTEVLYRIAKYTGKSMEWFLGDNRAVRTFKG